MNQCEYDGCKHKATQADTYLNSWLCNKHYSVIGNMTDNYQADIINWNLLESLVV